MVKKSLFNFHLKNDTFKFNNFKNSFFSFLLIIIIAFIAISIGSIHLYLKRYSRNIKYKSLFGFSETFENNNKPKIWYYWETMAGKKKPGYIDLCYDSIVHNCKDCFEIISLNENNITQYLPEVKDTIHLDHLSIPHKTDYYRYALLEKYGGVWIDADTIIVKCLCPLYKKLMASNKDYMGFGCGKSRGSCERNPGNSKNHPVNGLMMSKPKTQFMKCVKDKSAYVIENNETFDYHAIGRGVLNSCIHEMQDKDSNWDYIHTPSLCQEYDSKGKKLNNIMTPYNVKDCSGKRYFFFLYNTAPGYPDWFKDLSKKELMSGNGGPGEKYYLNEILTEAFSKKESCT